MRIIPPKYFKMNLNKKPLTKANLLTQIGDIDIYTYYLGETIGMKTAISSPFRADKKPSFGFFLGESGEICWKDFVEGTGDCISFVQKLFNLDFNAALIKIVIDMDLSEEFEFRPIDIERTSGEFIATNREETVKRLSEGRKLDIKKRKAQLYDIEFWMQFGISKQTLIKYNVTPIEYYFVNGAVIKTDKYAYAFIEYKDGIETYKIYQPFNKDFKWINNHNESVWQGWAQLPEKGETLIITKSLKDVMSITEILGIPAVSLQSESVFPKAEVVKELHSRFEDIYLLYDNDYDKEVNWGQVYGKKLAREFNFFNIVIRDNRECKDFSDLVKKYGAVQSKQLWDNELSIPY